jgi:tryptophan-rich sensory protein
MQTYEWYQQLLKPSWAPPAWIFGPVWTILYAIIAVTFGVVFFKAFNGKIRWLVALPFALNLIFNLIFTPIQFGLRSNELAAVDVVLVWLTIIWAFYAIWPHERWIVLANIPYFLWVSFATVLQLTITYMNRSNS